MDTTQPMPTALKIVAWLFIIGGVLAIIEVLVSLMHNHINLNFGVLGVFIGPGLLRLSPGWRTCGLVFLWIGLILLPIVLLAGLASGGPATLSVLGQPVGHVPMGFMLILGCAIYALLIWEYRVLTRPDVRRLFGLVSEQ